MLLQILQAPFDGGFSSIGSSVAPVGDAESQLFDGKKPKPAN